MKITTKIPKHKNKRGDPMLLNVSKGHKLQ